MTAPQMWLNGYHVQASWGPTTMDLPPGRYELKCAVRYMSDYGRATTQLDVAPGRQVDLYYTAPAGPRTAGVLGPAHVETPGKWVYWAVGAILLLFVVFVIVLPIVYWIVATRGM